MLFLAKLGIFVSKKHYPSLSLNGSPSRFLPRNLYKKVKMSPRLYPLREMAWFNMASQRPKVQLALPTGKICEIQDGLANSEIGYYK